MAKVSCGLFGRPGAAGLPFGGDSGFAEPSAAEMGSAEAEPVDERGGVCDTGLSLPLRLLQSEADLP
ncbi:hypothetical protein D3C71_1682760 [compost metagenome]